jgi:Zn-dependent protease
MHPLEVRGPCLRVPAAVPVLLHWSLPALGGGISLLPAMSDARISIFPGFLYITLALTLLLLVHELGHALVARVYSVPIAGILISAYGGVCVVAEWPNTRGKRLLFIAGGVLAQFALLVAATSVLLLVGAPASLWATCFAFVFVGLNAAYIAFNILPLRGNDGRLFFDELRRVRSDAA